MAFNRLCLSFRQITLNRQNNIIARYCSSHLSKEQNNVLPFPNFAANALGVAIPKVHIKFAPKTLNIDFGDPDRASKKNINELPLSKYIPSMEEPLSPRPIQQDLPLIDKSFELPTIENTFEKLAIRLVVIRRKKVKKHWRKKLRKKMKFILAKIRIKRNLAKEKAFQAELIAKIKEAHMFSAEAYVTKRLSILDKERLPKTFRGEILHPDMIREFIRQIKERKEKRKNLPVLTLD